MLDRNRENSGTGKFALSHKKKIKNQIGFNRTVKIQESKIQNSRFKVQDRAMTPVVARDKLISVYNVSQENLELVAKIRKFGVWIRFLPEQAIKLYTIYGSIGD